MPQVTGSKQEHLIVVPDQPGKRLAKRLVYWLLFGLFSVGSFLLGEYLGMASQQSALVERDLLRAELAEKRAEIEALAQEVTTLRVGADIDRQSTDTVRLTIKQLEEEKFQLQQDLAFYKNIMAPKSADKGLRIQKYDLQRAEQPGHYRLKLMLTQVSDNNSLLSGLATVSVVGRQEGIEKSLALKDLSDEVSEQNIRLGFRYFQNIPGPDERFAELVIPEGFEPDYVLVVAQSRGPKPKRVEQKIPWQFEETVADASESKTQGD
ncbi:DUF6776 family protein [Aestuariirhabdus litorea]|uniref:Uncharacterized protein n=1 Tax=Aestuariirhabdus litorea TaxID=2528527 RepID=A0A3P3VM86_9GAMM|nr:DUF6776 family protein [Aestuariirhabdus litorea]RRJ83457.1 hypothetical protein D0544_16720 [Aestuariirhabdus litorea]RWW93618.1 hypothetical protein DZC74_16690 [Endozoicomonadaceae bacterium GTF-13]